ncbi:Tma16p KNAG_0G02660 [Huiozyma naganishii CBS 8797]|uniref:Translation machinery-associated protein 16 n=1 Tax=Huiozyma naganishii (strain ATCC MYA-139 / BCRC 22969 / CBS 8797 / KCTC 17520 / NBRC 10181 / NCYC 3082 / Yp74L-3) TaxID=1071383 RepID=J7S169_HUIN7|nr:hypothetical protein KNAG_0G02660 [Kazachstania naganishii CBS 8797]CCK71322.1 hypothetical protein KNAG_0G02660 [Kazachstania naganishii CBS 8797]
MPLSKSLSKIHKNIKAARKATGKPAGVIHPNGRRFKQLNRATLREEKLALKKRLHFDRRACELQRVKFIQDLVNSEEWSSKTSFSLEETVEFISLFIARDDAELDALVEKRRKDRPPSKRQESLQQRREVEQRELETGFLVPDLTSEANVKFLRQWDNDLGAMSTLQTVRVDATATQVSK